MIDIKKILTTSTEVYIKSKGKKISDYDLTGVELKLHYASGGYQTELEEKLESEIEVITDITKGLRENSFLGTALIPKEKK